MNTRPLFLCIICACSSDLSLNDGLVAKSLFRTAEVADTSYAPFAATRIDGLKVSEIFGSFGFEESERSYTRLRPHVTSQSRDKIAFAFEDNAGIGTVERATDGTVTIDWVVSGAFDRVAMSFACEDTERFFGLGAQIAVEHTGKRVPIWTSEQGIGKAAYGMPRTLLGLGGSFYDSYAPIAFTVSSAQRGFCSRVPRVRIQADSKHFRLQVIPDGSMREVLTRFARRTGTPPILAKWALSAWVDVFGGQEAVRTAAHELKAAGTPVSAIWAEDWVGTVATPFGENLSYDWEPDTSRFADIAALTGELHAQGLKFLTYMNAFMPVGTRPYADALTAGLLVSDDESKPMNISFAFGAPLYLLDCSTAAGAALYARYATAAVALGIDGWMADYGEELPYHAVLLDGRTGADAHNDYPRLWGETNMAALSAARPDGDFVTWNRSGAAGLSAQTSPC